MQRWVERPEARWALWSGISAALTMFVAASVMILADPGSTAAFGFIFVPLIAVAAAVPVAVWGAALGHVVRIRRDRPIRKVVHETVLIDECSAHFRKYGIAWLVFHLPRR